MAMPNRNICLLRDVFVFWEMFEQKKWPCFRRAAGKIRCCWSGAPLLRLNYSQKNPRMQGAKKLSRCTKNRFNISLFADFLRKKAPMRWG